MKTLLILVAARHPHAPSRRIAKLAPSGCVAASGEPIAKNHRRLAPTIISGIGMDTTLPARVRRYQIVSPSGSTAVGVLISPSLITVTPALSPLTYTEILPLPVLGQQPVFLRPRMPFRPFHGLIERELGQVGPALRQRSPGIR